MSYFTIRNNATCTENITSNLQKKMCTEFSKNNIDLTICVNN